MVQLFVKRRTIRVGSQLLTILCPTSFSRHPGHFAKGRRGQGVILVKHRSAGVFWYSRLPSSLFLVGVVEETPSLFCVSRRSFWAV